MGENAVTSDVATELRSLASAIEALTRESRVCSIAWPQVQALVDYLALRAHVSEIEARAKPGGTSGTNPLRGRTAAIRKPPMCTECGKDRADPPGKLCVGCEAYRDHTGHF